MVTLSSSSSAAVSADQMVAGRQDRKPRRLVELTGFGVLPDQRTFGLKLLDLSYDGCRVRTEAELFAGLQLKVSILGVNGALDAVVRWYRNGEAGIQFNPEEQAERDEVPRKHNRIELDVQLALRRTSRQAYYGRALDLSPLGCRVEFVERPKINETMWVKLDGLDAIEAVVRWVDGFFGGLEFVRPIYPVIFEMVLKRLGV